VDVALTGKLERTIAFDFGHWLILPQRLLRGPISRLSPALATVARALP
jgi:hypothetical protein